jgi:hypothetical protein
MSGGWNDGADDEPQAGSESSPLAEAIALFHRLGLDVGAMSASDFHEAYFELAKMYHPDHNPDTAELMANINAARLTIVTSYKFEVS